MNQNPTCRGFDGWLRRKRLRGGRTVSCQAHNLGDSGCNSHPRYLAKEIIIKPFIASIILAAGVIASAQAPRPRNPLLPAVVTLDSGMVQRLKTAIETSQPDGARHSISLLQRDAQQLVFGLALALDQARRRAGVISCQKGSRDVIGNPQFIGRGTGGTLFTHAGQRR